MKGYWSTGNYIPSVKYQVQVALLVHAYPTTSLLRVDGRGLKGLEILHQAQIPPV